jgi:glycosyltransferase involved in cell wall biosynthesis
MILVTGTYPPERCGVADYSARLLETETAQKAGWKLLYTRDVRLKAIGKTIKEIKSLNDKEVNIQYPSRGYMNSILPHVLCLYLRLFTNIRISTTIHEYTQLGWKGRLASAIFLLCSHKLIFTNPFERDAAVQAVKSVKRKSAIIKIFSNIPTSNNVKSIADRKYDVGYFGYIRPAKGIEEFIEVIGAIQQKNPIKAYILGQTLPDLKEYADGIFKAAKAAGIELLGSMPDAETADVLADTKIGYLPLPDGLSERRGSFLAYAKNQSIIIANDGPFVSDVLRKHCIVVGDTETAKAQIEGVIKGTVESINAIQKSVIEYITKELPSSWDDVVQNYIDFLKHE